MKNCIFRKVARGVVTGVVAFAMCANMTLSSFSFTAAGETKEAFTSYDKNRLMAALAENEEPAFTPKSVKAKNRLLEVAKTLPKKFDLRDVGEEHKNYVTPVKNQGAFGTCWSFGPTAASETTLLYENGITAEQYKEYVGHDLDLSEKATAWYTFHQLTSADAGDEVPASQIGEGVRYLNGDTDLNASYLYGGTGQFVTSLYAAGMGPKDEYTRFEGEELEYPFMYRGKLNYKGRDFIDASGDALSWLIEVVKKHYPDNTDKERADFIEKVLIPYYKEHPDELVYMRDDDWSLPNDKEHRFSEVAGVLQESVILPNTTECEDGEIVSEVTLAAVKEQLLKGHAMGVAYHADISMADQEPEEGEDQYVNTSTWAHYVYDPNIRADHEVCVIGYDDNYSRDNFLKGKSVNGKYDRTPPGDGAFICKNSWGSEDWGNAGYFYLSYYDKSIEDLETFDFYTDADGEENPAGNDYYVNQYDFSPMFRVYTSDWDEEVSMSNVFEAVDDQKINGVSVLTSSMYTTVDYEIYELNKNYKNPRDGKLLEKGIKDFDYGGYHRITLKKNYPIAKGKKFSVVATHKVESDSGDAHELVCNYLGESDDVIESISIVNPGESLLSIDNRWMDWADCVDLFDTVGPYKAYDNFAIKAYSLPLTGAEKKKLENSKPTRSITVGGKKVTSKAVTFAIKKKKLNKSAYSLKVNVAKDVKYSISVTKTAKKLRKYIAYKNGNVILKKKAPKGNYKFTITAARDDTYKITTTKVVTIKVE